MSRKIIVGADEPISCPSCKHAFPLEGLAAKDEALGKARSGELDLRRQLREVEEAKRNIDVEYQRKLDEERKRIAEQERAAAGWNPSPFSLFRRYRPAAPSLSARTDAGVVASIVRSAARPLSVDRLSIAVKRRINSEAGNEPSRL